jgi:hypothetical protein
LGLQGNGAARRSSVDAPRPAGFKNLWRQSGVLLL